MSARLRFLRSASAAIRARRLAPVVAGLLAILAAATLSAAPAYAQVCAMCGDANGDSAVNVGDLIAIQQAILNVRVPACPSAADADGSGGLMSNDIVRLVNS